MASTVQLSCRISRPRRRAASIPLALVVILLAATLATRPAQAQNFTTLANIDGGFPVSGLVQDVAGNFYGTTGHGGAPGCNAGCGVVFKMDPSGTVTALYTFTGGADGGFPLAGVVLDAAGNLYGTTEWGGVTGGSCTNSFGCGVMFKLDPSSGTETVLHTFTGGADGSGGGGLVLDATGNLYGTTGGAVFKLDTVGTFTVLYTFTGGTDGLGATGVIRDAAGDLYGTTMEGGGTGGVCGSFGCGTVFKLDPTGTETVLYRFTGGADGFGPSAGLVLDVSGDLYGTSKGGLLDCFQINPSSPPNLQQIHCGVVFKLDPSGTYTVLHSFTGPPDGFVPVGLVMDAAGNLYGNTVEGGTVGTFPCTISTPPKPIGCGTIFKLDPTGKEDVLYSFNGQADGGLAGGDLHLDPAGNLYGSSFDTVFKLTTPPDFWLSASELMPSTVSRGAPATSTVDVMAISGFGGSVALACLVQPTPALAPTCSFTSGSVTPGTAVTLTVRTTGPSGALISGPGSVLLYALWFPLIGLVATCIRFGSDQTKRSVKLTTAALALVLFAGLVFQVGCGGGSSSGGGGTPAGAYTITVNGTDVSGSLVHHATTALAVQ